MNCNVQPSLRTTGPVPFNQVKKEIPKGYDIAKVTKLDTSKAETKSRIYWHLVQNVYTVLKLLFQSCSPTKTSGINLACASVEELYPARCPSPRDQLHLIQYNERQSLLEHTNTVFPIRRGGHCALCWFVEPKYGDAPVVSTLEESLQKSSVMCTAVQSLWSPGHGKNILLRIYNRTIFNCITHNTSSVLIVQMKMAPQLQRIICF